ncbi:MAG: SLOG family protein [Eubacteriales bacterium]|nr:SLOG family protein [Eubacteriales bacterium]
MKSKTACFTGHRNINRELYPIILEYLIEFTKELIKKGIVYYGIGGARGFDILAGMAILSLKKEYPNIKLILILPCADHTIFWNERDILFYKKILEYADKVVYISEKYTEKCMIERNNHLVENSSYCISYLTKNKGGTAYTVDMAKKLGLKVYNIANYIV